MIRDSKLLRLLALLFTFSLAAAACGDSDEEGAGETAETTPIEESENTVPAEEPEEGVQGGTLVWTHEQEPPDLNADDPSNGLTVTSWIVQALHEGLHGVTGGTEFFPELLAEEAEVVENDDGTATVNFTLREGLTWSDGEPLTADDVKFTFDVFTEGCPQTPEGTFDVGGEGCLFPHRSPLGYNMITNFEVTSPTQFSLTFTEFFAGYQTLFNRVLPGHTFEGADAAAVATALKEWTHNGEVLPSSGPLVFAKWDRGVGMDLVRNDNYHGSVSPDVRNQGQPANVDGVRINFVTDTDAQVNSLLSGEAHVIMAQPQTQFERLASDEQITVASLAGPVWEHWGFNMLNPHLSKPEVREAIAYAIDKSEIVEGLYAPLFGDLLPVEGLGNAYWMSNQEPYVDQQTEYHGAKIEEAQAKLEEAGYTQGSDGIYAHPEAGRLSLRVGTTGGNKLREDQQQIIQQQLADAGIEIVIDNVPGGAYFSERPFSEQALAAATTGGAEGDPTIWDIAQFAWVGGPWPGSATEGFTGPGSPYGFLNQDFADLAASCETMPDEGQRADCYNEASLYLTSLEQTPEGLVVVPLTQKPSFFAYSNAQLASGAVAPDANDAGPLVNVVDYQFAE